jgi:phage shock protein A
MWKMTIVSSVVSMLAFAGIHISNSSDQINSDTAAAECAADPDRFFDRVEEQAASDLSRMEKTRSTLRTQLSDLAEQEEQVVAKRNYARFAAEEFRSAWSAGAFPVTVHGRVYSQPEIEGQVSTLLSQIDGYETALQKFQQTADSARQHVEDLTCRIVRTETDLALIGVRREVYKATRSDESVTELMATVDSLFSENAVVIAASPIRSVDELMASDASSSVRPYANSKAIAWLTANHQ